MPPYAARSSSGLVVEPTVASDDQVDLVHAGRSARLVVISGSRAGSAITLGGDETTLGRATNNDVVLSDISVSRRHALLRREPGGYLLVDQDSGNGTRLNGRGVQAARLRNGDEITLGDAVVQFVDAGRIAARGRMPVRRGLPDMLRRASLVEPWTRARLVVAASLVTPLLVTAGAALWRAKHDQSGIARPDFAAAIAPTTEAASAGMRAGIEVARVDEPAAGSRRAPAPEPPRRADAGGVVVSPAVAIAGVRRAYVAGDLAKAIALARGIPSARPLLRQLEKFSSAWREGVARAGERRVADAIAALERAEAADATLDTLKAGAFSRKLRKSLADLHAQLGATQFAAGQLAPAAAHLRAALLYDPGDERAGGELQRIVALANDAYLRGYVAKDIDEDVARGAFRTAVAVLPPSDVTARKARRWLERLDGKAGKED